MQRLVKGLGWAPSEMMEPLIGSGQGQRCSSRQQGDINPHGYTVGSVIDFVWCGRQEQGSAVARAVFTWTVETMNIANTAD